MNEATAEGLPQSVSRDVHSGEGVRFGYLTGWRIKSEVLTRQWKHVDRHTGVVRLEPGETKNGKGRTFPFDVLPELRDVIDSQWEYTKKWQRILGRNIPWVFHREGNPIRDFRSAWRAACIRAGLATPVTDERDARCYGYRDFA